ncbi:PREDICTED: VQ motif-containing protein 9-like, partial [Brassica oleracea var. oleracea]|uniref:VQ motif-containing protein 9-like n=1 Tax=Brassica oleracea var. oleracea TaxID=109376 RepID=UPI0006A6BAF4
IKKLITSFLIRRRNSRLITAISTSTSHLYTTSTKTTSETWSKNSPAHRPPPLINTAALVPHPSWSGGFVAPRPTAPLSPLPPLPPVHAAAESPVSSYMRYLQNSMFAMESNRREFSGLSPLAPLVSPRWYQQQQQENAPPPVNSGRPPSGTVSQAPPQSLGCLSSPKSPYGLLSPSLLLSPTSGQLGFPASPTTVPLPSPK